MDDSSTCPFCFVSLPSSQLQWHANTHFEDDDSRSPPSKKAVSGDLHFDTTFGDSNNWCGGGIGRDNGVWTMEEEISHFVDLQIKGEFHNVNGGLMNLLRNCLESEGGNSKSILSVNVDHFQSLQSEDVGWGCGWRNIQMLSSHLLAQKREAKDVLFGCSGFVPDIPSLQRWLEIAWERGFDEPGSHHFNNSIYGSKRWIGATECAALLRSFGLRARVIDFGPKESESLYLSVPGSSVGEPELVRIDNGRKRKAPNFHGPMDRYLSRGGGGVGGVSQASCGTNAKSCSSLNVTIDKESGGKCMVKGSANQSKAHQVLMDFVWNYFSDKNSIHFGYRRVVFSEKTPLYFQHDGHSRTIVGIQVKYQRNGNPHYNLLVLDPGHRTEVIERSLREKVGWQRFIKRGVHTLTKQQYQLCYVDPGIATEEEMKKLKTMDSVFIQL
ncbi:unnamed protein product [Lathyrus sativus]|nr:unnamed protein product [Lathyrus sativus]